MDVVTVGTVSLEAVRDVRALPDIENVLGAELQVAPAHDLGDRSVGIENADAAFALDEVGEADGFGDVFSDFVFHDVKIFFLRNYFRFYVMMFVLEKKGGPMRGQLYVFWYKEEHADRYIYWQLLIPKWIFLWFLYLIYSVLNVICFLWFFRRVGLIGRKSTIEEWMIKYPRLWAVPFVVSKEDDLKFNYGEMIKKTIFRSRLEEFCGMEGFRVWSFYDLKTELKAWRGRVPPPFLLPF